MQPLLQSKLTWKSPNIKVRELALEQSQWVCPTDSSWALPGVLFVFVCLSIITISSNGYTLDIFVLEKNTQAVHD